VRGDDREDVVLLMVEVVDDDRPGERHHGDHHGEARLARHKRRDDAGAAEELADRRRPLPARLDVLVSQEGGDPLRVGPYRRDERQPEELEGACGEPERGEAVAVEVASRQHGAEDHRPENRTEDGAEEDERDPARSALRRVHVAACRPGEQGDAVRDPDPGQPGKHE
jgi:hypothetical protein